MNFLRVTNLLYRFFGYIAVWPAMYALGVFILGTWLVLGTGVNSDSTVYILLCAHNCYLLDRVKVTDRRQDPADALALPIRAFLFSRFSKPVRWIVGFELLASTLVGWRIHPLLAVIPLISCIVVHLYAGRGASPESPRLKDLPAIKAFMTASGHLALTFAVLWANQHDLLDHASWNMAATIFGLWFIVSGDAVLCDIDDHNADNRYSTKSLSVMLGTRSAWFTALGLIALGSFLIVFNPVAFSASIGIGATLVVTTLATQKNPNHRDFVDVRLLPIVLIWIWAVSS